MTTYLGVDVGTSATRVVLVGDDGTIIDAASSSYDTMRAPAGVVEQDPTMWTVALSSALSSLTKLTTDPPVAIGLCGQTPTMVLVDDQGKVTRNALTWQDGRATVEAAELADRFGEPEALVGTGLPWSAANMPAKLLWLSRHEPEVVASTRIILQPKDFIGMELTGTAMSDPWSSKGLCRVSDGAALGEVLDACGWSSSVCPPTAPPWSPRGVVSELAAQKYGLVAGTPVTVGASDALAEMFAAGCFERESAFVFSGTSSIVGTTVRDTTTRVKGLFNVPTSCAPLPLLYGPTQSGGAALLWAARLLGCSVDEILTLAASSGPSWPTFVPYLAGERAPLWDLDVRALFLGVDEGHGRAEMAMSVVMGVFLSARHVLALIEEATHHELRDVEVVGRGVRNLQWETIARRALGLSLRLHEDADMSARGSAMLALALDGTSVVEASRRLSAASRQMSPTVDEIAQSRRLLERYRQASDQATQWRRLETD
jgi:xylulokinase